MWRVISNTLWLRKRAQKLLSPNARYPLTSTHPHQQSPPPHINGHYHHLARQRITTRWPHLLSKFFFVSFFSLNAIITSTSIRVHPRPSPAPIRAHPRLSPPASITFPHPCPSASVPIRVRHHPPPNRAHPRPSPVAPTTTAFTRVEGQPHHRASLSVPTATTHPPIKYVLFYFIRCIANRHYHYCYHARATRPHAHSGKYYLTRYTL